MEIKFTSEGNSNVLKLIGELDTPASNRIQGEIDRIAGLKDKNLIVDCSELEYIASSGLRQFLTLRKATMANKLELTFTGVRPSVMTVFKVTNLDKILNIK